MSGIVPYTLLTVGQVRKKELVHGLGRNTIELSAHVSIRLAVGGL